MQSPPRTDPPYVPIRRTAWATRRSPRLLIVAVVVLVAIAVLVALAHRPSPAERTGDLNGFLHDMTTDIESCAGGVGESLAALRQLEPLPSRNASEVKDTIGIATYGANNCEPANNMQIDDLDQYQVTESLASFHLARVVTGLVNWAAPDAIDVQNDVVLLLRAPSGAARSRATAALDQAITRLDAQRSVVDAELRPAIRSLSARAAPPRLPG